MLPQQPISFALLGSEVKGGRGPVCVKGGKGGEREGLVSKEISIGVAVLIRNFGKDRARGSGGGSCARLAVNTGERRKRGNSDWMAS